MRISYLPCYIWDVSQPGSMDLQKQQIGVVKGAKLSGGHLLCLSWQSGIMDHFDTCLSLGAKRHHA